MRLAIITAFPPSKVTLNEYAFHLVKELRRNKKVTELFLLTDKTDGDKTIPDTVDGCKVKVIECWEFNKLKNVVTINKAISKIKPDGVLLNLQFMKFGDNKIAAALGLMTPLILRLRSIPNIVLLHNIMEEVDLEEAGFTKNFFLRWVYQLIGSFLTVLILSANKVAVTIKSYVETLQKKYKVSNVTLIPHGTFETPKKPDFIIPNDTFDIMTFGKFGTYKKVEVLIEAFQRIQEMYDIPLSLTIAGTDNPNVPGYLDSVQKKYEGVKNMIFTGYVEEEDVPMLFTRSSVVVFPYTSTTGSSGVLHQAGSYGKAVVMPEIGDLKHIINDEGYKGEFFQPESVDSLVNALSVLVKNDSYRMEMGKNNYEAATAYPMSRIAEMYVSEFEKLIYKKKDDVPVLVD